MRSAAQLLGPLLGGLLVTTYRPEFVISINSLTFIIALAALFLIPGYLRSRPGQNPAKQIKPNKTFFADLGEGISLVWKSKQIRLVVISGALLNIFVAGGGALFALFVTRTLGFDSSTYGISVAIAGFGALLGSLTYRSWDSSTYRSWASSFSDGPCVAIGLTSMTLGAIFIALSVSTSIPIIMILAGQVLTGYGAPILNIALVTLRQKLTPPAVLGRVNATARVAIMSSLPIGALLVSALAEAFSISFALWIGALGEILVLVVLGPFLLRLRIPRSDS